MKHALLIGASVSLAALSTAAVAQPVGGRATPQTLQESQQAFQRQAQARQQAEVDAARRMLDRDVQIGNLTPAQRDQLTDYARQRVQQFETESMGNVRRIGENVIQDLVSTGNSRMQALDEGAAALDPANADRISDRRFGEDVAHAGVQSVDALLGTGRGVLEDSRDLLNNYGRAAEDIIRERERLINSNPNVSAEERQRVRGETQRVERSVAAFPSRLDQAVYRINEQSRRLREEEGNLARALEQAAATQGRDPTQWRPQPRQPGPAQPRAVPPPPPRPVPESAPPEAAPPPGPTPSQSASRGSGGSRRGTIPGQNGDPYEGLRVPRNQGGTGANPVSNDDPPPEQQQTDSTAQAESNAARTEDARRRAQEQARRDNQEADSIFGAAQRRREAQQAAERREVEDALRRSHQPGRAGGGSGGGAGASGGGNDLAELMSAYPAAGANDPAFFEQIRLIRDAAQRREFARRSDESARLLAAAARNSAQNERWRGLVESRFGPDSLVPYAQGQTLSTARLEQIYGPNSLNQGNVARSLSSAGLAGPSSVGNSLSSAGTSLSSVGFSLSSAGTDYRDPALESLHEALGSFSYRRRTGRFASGLDADPARVAQLSYNAGSFDIRRNLAGRENFESGGILAASLFSDEEIFLRNFLRDVTANGFTGVDRLLAQPFNVVLTWGRDATDLDLHLTGPLGEGVTERFHIYFAAEGDLAAQPFAQLIKDCICSEGSEVILTSALNRGGVYRVSVFNFDDQSASSTNLSSQSNATIEIVRGGTAVSVGNGTRIEGGRSILTATVPVGLPGNTWVAAELDPRNGRITVPGIITQNGGSANVP